MIRVHLLEQIQRAKNPHTLHHPMGIHFKSLISTDTYELLADIITAIEQERFTNLVIPLAAFLETREEYWRGLFAACGYVMGPITQLGEDPSRAFLLNNTFWIYASSHTPSDNDE